MKGIVIVGAGPAGIAAAVRAREAGAEVTLVDDNPRHGGQIWRGGFPARRTKQGLWFERFRNAGIPLLSGSRVVWADSVEKTLLIEQLGRPVELRYRQLILATGARELFLPFPGWTLPGVAGAGGLQALAKGGLPLAGKRVVVAGSGPLLLAAADYFYRHRANVVLVAEQAPAHTLARFGMELARHSGKLLQAAQFQLSLLGIPHRYGTWVERAEGRGRVKRLHLRSGNRRFIEAVDYAAIAYGLCPNTELAAALGCRVEEQGVAVDELQRTSVPDICCAGEATGIGGVDLSIAEGEIAGLHVAGRDEEAKELFPQRAKQQSFAAALKKAFALRPELKALPQPGTIVCRCEDVPYEALQHQPSSRAAKLHTRCGMGPCQGRVCGPATKFLFGWQQDSIRPPLFPAHVSTLAAITNRRQS